MLKPEFTGQFKRDYKLAVKRGKGVDIGHQIDLEVQR